MTQKSFAVVAAITKVHLVTSYPLLDWMYAKNKELDEDSSGAIASALQLDWVVASREGRSDAYCLAREALMAAILALSETTTAQCERASLETVNLASAPHEGNAVPAPSDEARDEARNEWFAQFEVFRKAALWFAEPDDASGDAADFARQQTSFKTAAKALIDKDYKIPAQTAPFGDHAELSGLANAKATARKRKRAEEATPAPSVPGNNDAATTSRSTPAPASEINDLPLPKSHVLAYETVRDQIVGVADAVQKVHVATSYSIASVQQLGKKLGQVTRYLSMVLVLLLGSPEQIAAQLPDARQVAHMAIGSVSNLAPDQTFEDDDRKYARGLLDSWALAREKARTAITASGAGVAGLLTD